MTSLKMDLHEKQQLNRTWAPKYCTYFGDGSGRDGYVVFGNGGQHDLRKYNGNKKEGFTTSPLKPRPIITPRKESTAFDYPPDGTGRDLYIIRDYGLKANYRSQYREFEKGLRGSSPTPNMDARHLRQKDPWGADASQYTNWPSMQAVKENYKIFGEQRRSIERLSPPKNTSRSRSPDLLDLTQPFSNKKPLPEVFTSRNKVYFEKRGNSVNLTSNHRPLPLKAQPAAKERFYSSFQRKYDNKRLASVEQLHEELRKGQNNIHMTYRQVGLQPIARATKVSSAMLRKEISCKMNNTLNIIPKQIKGHNPYMNIVGTVPTKVIPNTVMNSREKLRTVAQPEPPVTAQEIRGSKEVLFYEHKVKSAQGKSGGGGMSQMATTAPRNDNDYGFNSAGRITADLAKILDTKQANNRLADQTLTPALFAKKGQDQRPHATHQVFQKRSVSVYQKPRGMNDTF